MQVMVSKKAGPSDRTFQKSSDVGKAIGQQLRKIYDDIANEPLPDDFVELLQRLDDTNEGDSNDGKK